MKKQRILLLAGLMLVCSAFRLSAITVKGTVTDENKKPLSGVSVAVDKVKKGTFTDTKGNYSIEADKGAAITFTYLGCETQTLKVPDNGILNVVMQPVKVEICNLDVVECKEEIAYFLSGSVAGLSANKRVGSSKQAKGYLAVEYDACMIAPSPAPVSDYYPGQEEHSRINENRFINVVRQPLSTFSLDVDGASYTLTRKLISQGRMPEPDAVRVEEFVNYFSYRYPQPTGKDPVRITTQSGPCPWNREHTLVSIGVKAREIEDRNIPATNFVFLVDVSGSMYGRLPLVVSSMKLLVNNLRDNDRVAIVTYAGAAGLALASTPGSDPQKIREALDKLTAGGSTAGGEGIKLAYKVARENFIQGGNNRIILCTDGDFNVGVSSPEGLKGLIEQERKSGVYLTILGYGMGNYKDNRLQTLSEAGNGNYAYIDDLQQANKILVNEFGSTMYAVAKDVKLQVEFNPANVESYRLVGYESRLLRDEDFNDDKVDAGDLGAGHCVTALYEIVPKGSKSGMGGVDPLKYQPVNPAQHVSIMDASAYTGELMTVKLRYKPVDSDKSNLISAVVTDRTGGTDSDYKFASAVAMFAQVIRGSDFTGDGSIDKAIKLAQESLDYDPSGYRAEFIRLAQTTRSLK